MTIEMNGEMAPLFKALAKAQKAMQPAIKAAANSHFRSKYADISAVLDAILPPLNDQGLSLIQAVGPMDGNLISLTTILSHETGAYIRTYATSSKGRGDGPQSVGSGITYLRRYAAQSIVGLPCQDDDGNAAEGHKGNEGQKKTYTKPEPVMAKNKHDVNFKVNRTSIMMRFKDIGWNYDAAALWCEERTGKRPSGLKSEKLDKLIVHLGKLEPEVATEYLTKFKAQKAAKKEAKK